MPTLVKFCKPEHNILQGCHTIRVGTLEYYREMDPSFAIADPAEGIEAVSINSIDTSTASPEAIAAVAALAPLPHIQIQDMRLITTFPNCYIWCCSNMPDPILAEQGRHFDDAYTSCYAVSDPGRFAEHLWFLLIKNITRTAFVEPVQERLDRLSISEMGEISLSVYHRDVLYVDEKLSVIEAGGLSAYVADIPPMLRPIFVKPTKYSNDREYRFACWFQHQRYGPLAVKKDPVDLSIMPVRGF